MESGFNVEALEVSRLRRAGSDALAKSVASVAVALALSAGVSCEPMFREEWRD